MEKDKTVPASHLLCIGLNQHICSLLLTVVSQLIFPFKKPKTFTSLGVFQLRLYIPLQTPHRDNNKEEAKKNFQKESKTKKKREKNKIKSLSFSFFSQNLSLLLRSKIYFSHFPWFSRRLLLLFSELFLHFSWDISSSFLQTPCRYVLNLLSF